MSADSNAELKVLPTQPDHPSIPEEEGDDEDAHERVKEGDESEGVEVCIPEHRTLGDSYERGMVSLIT